MKKILRLFTASLLILAMCIIQPFAGVNVHAVKGYEPAGFKFSGKIVLIGDSTVCNYPESYIKEYNRYGWGMKLGAYYNNVTVENLAVGGTSSRTYLDCYNYKNLEKDLAEGDYLFIQFGHNDECISLLDRCTYTELDPDKLDSAGKNSEGKYSYEFFLKKYVDLATDRGAVPVFITPITCLGKEGEAYYTNHIPYRNAMIKLGQELNVPVIDMMTKTAAVYDDLFNSGKGEDSFKFHCLNMEDTTKIDHTHLSGAGAEMVASLLAPETKKLGLTLGNYLKKTEEPATEETTEKPTEESTTEEQKPTEEQPTEETVTTESTIEQVVTTESTTEQVVTTEATTTQKVAKEETTSKKPAATEPTTTQQTTKIKKPKAPTSVILKNSKSKKLTIKWSKVKDIKGYEVQYSLNKSFTKTRKAKRTSRTSLTVKNLKKKTYYVRVRAYRKDSKGKIVYGKWSAVKKIKIKK